MNQFKSDAVSLEVCSNSATSAIAARDGGAVRVELCENLKEGGTTPSYGQIAVTRKNLSIDVYVLIRPRSGDFLYSDVEFDIIKADVKHCIEAGVDGIVIGILHADGTVDKERCSELVRMAKDAGLGVTFHRAFDLCADLFQAMEDIIEIGCDRILTSGGKSTAIEGANVIKHLVEKAAGRIKIMPGSGVNERNVTDLIQFTGVGEVHSSARKQVASKMEYHNDHILLSNGYIDEEAIDVTDVEIVSQIIAAANS